MDAAATGPGPRLGPKIVLSQLEPLIDDRGIRASPYGEVSYRSADSGRALRLAVDLYRHESALHLAELSLAQLISAHRGAGRFTAPTDFDNALALRGIATASVNAPWPSLRAVARQVLDDASEFAATSSEAAATATVAAAQVLEVQPTSSAALTLLHNNKAAAESGGLSAATPVEVEALLRLAEQRSDPTMLSRSLSALAGIAANLDEETPAQISAIADACAVALRATGDERWNAALVHCGHRFRSLDQLPDQSAETLICALHALGLAQRAKRRRRARRDAQTGT